MKVEPNPSLPKIEAREIIFSSDRDILLEGYFDEVRNKSFRSRTQEDVARVVSLELSAEPITILTNEELSSLKDFLENYENFFKDYYINIIYKELAEDQIYFLAPKDLISCTCDYPIMHRFVFFNASLQVQGGRLSSILDFVRKTNKKPLDPDELIKLLLDSNAAERSIYLRESQNRIVKETNISGSGSRFLYPQRESDVDTYFYKNREEFKEKVDRVKERTGKQVLTMLDIGGHLGKALMDAKHVDPTIKTYNMTLETNLATKGDIVVRRPAEYMPAVFEEKMDIIESNFAFQYFLFPDIALKNAVKALSVGGEANISFVNYRCPLGKKELFKRMRDVFSWLQKLENSGYIEVARLESDPFLVSKVHLERQLQILKKKSTKNIQF